jgi:hypothetical protein
MTQPRDEFSKPVVEALGKRAAFICANPTCRTLAIAPSDADDEKWLYIGKAAHICAAAPGGPRYRADMTQEERKSASNGVFLCSNCADMIDKNNGLDFPEDELRRWKVDHDAWVTANLNKKPQASPSQIFHVTSIGQQGGITAGVVNVGRPPRILDDGLKQQLLRYLTDKNRVVTVRAVMGDSEALGLAIKIREYLVALGYNVPYMGQASFGAVQPPLHLNPETYTITVGGQQ